MCMSKFKLTRQEGQPSLGAPWFDSTYERAWVPRGNTVLYTSNWHVDWSPIWLQSYLVWHDLSLAWRDMKVTVACQNMLSNRTIRIENLSFTCEMYVVWCINDQFRLKRAIPPPVCSIWTVSPANKRCILPLLLHMFISQFISHNW